MSNNVPDLAAVLRSRLVACHRDGRGAIATEYAVLVGFIALVIVVGVGLFGDALDAWFAEFATAVGGW